MNPNFCSIIPYPILMEERWLYNLDPSKEKFIDVTIIGVSAYQSDRLRFTVVVEDTGAIFSYLPLTAFCHFDIRDNCAKRKSFSLYDLVYHTCPDNFVVVQYWDYLKSVPITVFIKYGDEFYPVHAHYIFSIEHPRDNILQHFVKLNNGQYAIVPNHKMVLKCNAESLPNYKKLRK